jgi:hypothetical protein
MKLNISVPIPWHTAPGSTILWGVAIFAHEESTPGKAPVKDEVFAVTFGDTAFDAEQRAIKLVLGWEAQ